MAEHDEYIKALEKFTAKLDDTFKIAHDPYKPPELTVFAAHDLMQSIWDLEIEYAVMSRLGKRKREAANES